MSRYAGLDERQIDILKFIRTWWAEHEYGPSVRDIMHGCGYASTSSVAYHLTILRDLGKIDYTNSVARTVRLT